MKWLVVIILVLATGGVLVGVFLFGGAGSGVDPRQAGPTLYFSASLYMEAVERRAREAGTLQESGRGLEALALEHGDYGVIRVRATPDGTITAENADRSLRVILVPALDGGTVRWSCRFQPPDHAPAWCRP